MIKATTHVRFPPSRQLRPVEAAAASDRASTPHPVERSRSWRLTWIWAAALIAALGAAASGCGVKGKPLPPITPPELGRGVPTFRRATEDLAFPNVAPVEPVPEPKASPRSSEERL